MSAEILTAAPGGPLDADTVVISYRDAAIAPPHLVDLARLAVHAAGGEFASIAFEGHPAAWVSAQTTLSPDGAPGVDPFRAPTAEQRGFLEIVDTVHDERFRATSFVVNGFGIRSYAGLALRNPDGECLGTLGVYGTRVRKVTEQQQEALELVARQALTTAELRARIAEAQLLAPASAPETVGSAVATAEPLLDAIFERVPIGIALSDRNGRLQHCNPALCNLLGFTAEELCARAVHDIVHDADITAGRDDIARLWRGDVDRVELDRRYLRKDGSAVWARTTTALVRQPDGTPTQAVEFLRDLTDLREAELALERTHGELAGAFREAGMAGIAAQTLDDIGQMLTAIDAAANEAGECVKRAKVQGLTRTAVLLQSQGAQLGAFVNDDPRGRSIPKQLASLAEQLINDQQTTLQELTAVRDHVKRIHDAIATQATYADGRGVVAIQPADLVEDSLRIDAAVLGRHRVTVQREFGEVPAITVDVRALLPVVVCLVRNAVRACVEAGRPDKLLTVRIERSAQGVRIAVLDNGAGVSAEDLPRLFDHGFPMRQAALAARELGGSLRGESPGAGRGAAFTLELPLTAPRESPAHG